jgi:hypothetical protein
MNWIANSPVEEGFYSNPSTLDQRSLMDCVEQSSKSDCQDFHMEVVISCARAYHHGKWIGFGCHMSSAGKEGAHVKCFNWHQLSGLGLIGSSSTQRSTGLCSTLDQLGSSPEYLVILVLRFTYYKCREVKNSMFFKNV